MYELRIDQIQILEELQSRASTDWKHVDELVELLQSGGQFKEHPVVFRQGHDGDEYFLADGFHRVHAYKKSGIESAIFDVRAGGTTAFRHAKLWSIQSNSAHGLRRKPADKRRAVEMLLADEEWSTKSVRWIAETAQVSHPFVASVKRGGNVSNSPVSGDDNSQFVTGVDGKKYPAKKKSQPRHAAPLYHCTECRNTFTEAEGECPRCYPPEPETVEFVPAEDLEFNEAQFQEVFSVIQNAIFHARLTWPKKPLMRLEAENSHMFYCNIPAGYTEAQA
jgi:hypothetical protein